MSEVNTVKSAGIMKNIAGKKFRGHLVAGETGAASEELDSSTALLSVFSGPEPLESSPQATNSTAAVIREIFPRYLLKGFAII